MSKYNIILVVLFTCAFFSMFCMEKPINQSNGIEINGKVKPILGHLILAMTAEPNHLKNIDFIRYEDGNVTIISKGKVLLTKEDLQAIKDKNFVYLPFYTLEKRGSDYENIGAIVIGTTNEEMAAIAMVGIN